jgi:phosphate transport system protein
MKIEMSKYILSSLEEALEDLRSQVATMADLTLRNIRHAERGLFERENAFCAAAISDDDEIDQSEMDIDRTGDGILGHYQPVASNLRGVISAMKIGSNLERVGDHAVTIARRARKLNALPDFNDVVLLRPMFAIARSLLDDSVRAYREQNPKLARGLRERDRDLNAAEVALNTEIVRCITRAPDRVESYLDLTFIARCLERVGDHAVSIGEDIVYATEAEDIRHGRID